MKRIGLISDTHGYWDERYKKYFAQCDEIWHAGDIGSYSIVQKLSEIAMLRAVYGNCDGYDIRSAFPEINRFKIEDVDIVMKHIGGSPVIMTVPSNLICIKTDKISLYADILISLRFNLTRI